MSVHISLWRRTALKFGFGQAKMINSNETQTHANQWGFIRGIGNDSLFTGPSAEANSGRLRRSICSSIDEK